MVRRTPDGETIDVTPPSFNARTRVHEYGGGAFAVDNGTIWFSNFVDQRLYRQDSGGEPQPVTPEADLRYADGVIDRRRRRMICVREDHSADGEPMNTIVSVSFEADREGGQVLISGSDFYASPRLSPDGTRLAWLTWNHPNMPWDGTELWIGEIEEDGSLGRREKVAGGVTESIFQPEWSPDADLYFISDRTGWWNPYRWRSDVAEFTAAIEAEQLVDMEAEFGRPQWRFGMSTYAFESAERVICSYTRDGVWHLASLDTTTGVFDSFDLPFSEIGGVQARPGRVFFRAGSPTASVSIVQLNLQTGKVSVIRRSREMEVDNGYLSRAEAIEFPSQHGSTAHAFFYPPRNRDYSAPVEEKPPLLVISHGGPTSATTSTLNWGIQYWTSRGMAVIDVNYGGSTGYGRLYRKRLEGQWGVVDVDDCVDGARYVVDRGEVDGGRLIIRGGSAGGYTTLCALIFRDVFAAGASYYGVSDAEALAHETHKFESRYLDGLIGPYPERRELYLERSPIHYADQVMCPVIFFQGLEDQVVLPNQAEVMVEALREKGVPVAYLPFEEEQHGFRRSANVQRALDAELYFYGRVFSFELADAVEPVRIEGMSAHGRDAPH